MKCSPPSGAALRLADIDREIARRNLEAVLFRHFAPQQSADQRAASRIAVRRAIHALRMARSTHHSAWRAYCAAHRENAA